MSEIARWLDETIEAADQPEPLERIRAEVHALTERHPAPGVPSAVAAS